MTVEHWWALLAIPPALAAVIVLARRGSRLVPARQHRWSVWARCVAVSLLIIAVAQPSLVTAVNERTVFFLLDRSDSISVETRAEQQAIVDAALAESGPTIRVGLGVFGADLEVDTALTVGLSEATPLAEVDGSATDLAGALRATASLLPSEGSRRVVVLSDLVETSGDTRSAARELEEAGIAVDVVPLVASRSADALIESIRLPATARVGETVAAQIGIRSNRAGPATLVDRRWEWGARTGPGATGGGRTGGRDPDRRVRARGHCGSRRPSTPHSTPVRRTTPPRGSRAFSGLRRSSWSKASMVRLTS